MSTSGLLMLAAIMITYIFWRRARAESLRARVAAAVDLDSRTWTLEPDETADGRGFRVLRPDGTAADTMSLDWQRDGLLATRVEVNVPGEPPVRVVRPGEAVTLVDAGTAGEARVEVVLDEDEVMAGVVAQERAREVARVLEAGEIADAMVLWVHETGAMTVLLVHSAIVMDT